MKVKIKKEKLPTRCEICHKVDHYNPETNHCTRCSQIVVVVSRSKDIIGSDQKDSTQTYFSLYFRMCLASSLGFVALIMAMVSFAVFCKYMKIDVILSLIAALFFGTAVAGYICCSNIVRRVRDYHRLATK